MRVVNVLCWLKGVSEYAFIINDDPYPDAPSITQGLFFLIGRSGKGEIKFCGHKTHVITSSRADGSMYLDGFSS